MTFLALFGLFWVVGGVITWRELRRAPFGYQDSTGCHIEGASASNDPGGEMAAGLGSFAGRTAGKHF